MNRRLLIVGGGIAGLAAAWEAQRRVGDDYLLVESAPRLGGKIITRRLAAPDGSGEFIIDGGPESFVTRKPELIQLAEETGLSEALIDPGTETDGMHVLTDGVPLPVPMTPGSLVRTPLLSATGKARLLAEPFIKAKTAADDESLDAFARRRLGPQAAERMLGPVLGGIHQADPERQSLQATAPALWGMERDHGSLFRALLVRAKTKKRQPPARYPAFLSFAHGAQALVDGVAAQLAGDITTNTSVVGVQPGADGFAVHLSDGQTVSARAVILACPVTQAAGLLDDHLAGYLRRIRTVSIGTATLVYPAGSLAHLDRIGGCMVPRREGRRIDAVMVTSRRMPDRSVPGYHLVRVVFGANDPGLVGADEAQLRQVIGAELAAGFGVGVDPVASVSFHWPQGYPQADVGHLARLDAWERRLPQGLAVAGAAYRGAGVPDCIRQGRAAATLVLTGASA